jgi:integrase
MPRLLDATSDTYRVAIATALFSGVRLAELLGVIWSEIDFAEKVIRVRYQLDRAGERQPLKTDAGRRDVILMDRLATALRQHRLAAHLFSDVDLVFATARAAPHLREHPDFAGPGSRLRVATAWARESLD